jgi:hypothetical protein
MPSVNLTHLHDTVYQTQQRIEYLESSLKTARSDKERAIKALAAGEATIARRKARGESDTESEEDTEPSPVAEAPPTVPLPSGAFMSKKEIAALTKIYTNPKKVLAAWKRVLSEGLRENINAILEECRDTLFDGYIEGATPAETSKILKDWPAFCDKVYARLKNDGSFITGDEEIFQNFEDTAGGCDDIVWDAARETGCEIVKEMRAAAANVN